MSEWSPDADGTSPDESPDAERGVARVMTLLPILLRLEVTPHPRQPEGHVVFRAIGTLGQDDGLSDAEPTDDAPAASNAPRSAPRDEEDEEPPVLAQGSLPAATFDAVQRVGLFREPVPLMLTAEEHDGGIRGVLAAIVPARLMERVERERRAADEPWLASVESSPAAVGFGPTDEGTQGEPHVPFALGVILRFPEDRKHPDALDEEAMDLLATVLSGRAMDADRRRVENLLKSL